MDTKKINDQYILNIYRVKVISPNKKVTYECLDETYERYLSMYRKANDMGYSVDCDTQYGEVFNVGVFLHSLKIYQNGF